MHALSFVRRRTPYVLSASALLFAAGAPAGLRANEAPVPSTVTESAPRSPLAGLRFYVDPASRASRQADEWERSRPADAAAMRQIATQPQADWFGDWDSDVRKAVEARTRVIRRAGAVPLYVAYNIPLRDCGSHSAGGARAAEAYRTWIRSFAAGLGAGPAVVILEPDAVAGSDCLTSSQREERYGLLRDAVRILKDRPETFVYLDAGHPGWHSPEETAARLRQAGGTEADGFSLNVSNTFESRRNVEYGQAVSRLIPGARFVVDTSRSGLGPDAAREWCNPSGRALGEAPTTTSSHEGLDAFLWIKRPGESDGRCNGGPSAGEWWAEYALGLAQRSERG